MKRRWSGLAVALLLLLAAPGSARERVELPGGRVYEVRVDGDVETLWIALAPPEGGTLDGLEVGRMPVDVAVGNLHDTALRRAIAAKLVPSGEGQGPGIELEVRLAALPQPGTYDVLLDLRQGAERQLLKVQLLVPEAQLRVQATPLVERVVGLTGEAKSVVSPFVLSETSRRSRVTSLSVQPASPPMSGERVVVGHLEFQPGEGSAGMVPLGGGVSIPYAASGDFPLGTVRGSVELRSPQLAAPLSVPYEVRTRRTRWCILLLLAGGLLMGYLTRTGLKYLVDLNEKRLQREALRLRIQGELASHPDALFQDSLKKALTLLDEAAEREVQTLADAVAEAERRRAQAEQKLEERHARAQATLDELTQRLETSGSLPPGVQQRVLQALEELAALRALLEGGNVLEVTEREARLVTRLGGELVTELRQWSAWAGDAVERLREAPLPLRKGDQPAFQARLDQLQAAVGELPLDAARPEFAPLLEHTHKARVMFQNTATSLRMKVARTLKGVRAHLEGSGVALGDLDQQAGAWSQTRTQSAEEELDWVLENARAAQRVLDAATVEQLGPNVTPEARVLIEERRYVELAALVARLKRLPVVGPGGTFGGPIPHPPQGGPVAPVGVEPPITFTDAPIAVVRTLSGLARVIRFLHEPSPASTAYARSLWGLLWAKAARTAIAAIGILVVGYLLFQEGFVGTPQEMATIFVWGFTIDVSVDALTDVLTKGFKRT